ncbi:unnamed protein product [Sphagnum jensenii]|uniref:NADH-ubiquinone reductase complex 1 MLRQ subunit n=1 Tax=Sphagnum jensenii TaxID=128206 RepID=A0ABP1C126_9BRYO
MALNPSRWSQHWIRPEIVPLFAAVATGMGLAGFMVARHVTLNPDVRVNKEDREAGILDNQNEGKTYKDHGLRSYLRERRPEIMPAINDAFSKLT